MGAVELSQPAEHHISEESILGGGGGGGVGVLMRCMGGGLLLVVDEALDALEPCSALKESNEAEAPVDQGFRTAAAGRRVSRARPAGLLA